MRLRCCIPFFQSMTAHISNDFIVSFPDHPLFLSDGWRGGFMPFKKLTHMSMFANNALLGVVRIREQRKIEKRSKAPLSLWWQTWDITWNSGTQAQIVMTRHVSDPYLPLWLENQECKVCFSDQVMSLAIMMVSSSNHDGKFQQQMTK